MHIPPANTLFLKINFWGNENGRLAFKEIPSVMTQGATINDVMENINNALSLYAQDSLESIANS
jgi:hypothetical protein